MLFVVAILVVVSPGFQDSFMLLVSWFFVVVILVVPVLVCLIVGILVVVSPGFQDSFGSCC